MKIIAVIFFGILLLACNNEDAPNCIQSEGTIIQQEFTVPFFDKITVFERVELIITDVPTQQVIVETGKNLLNDIEVSVNNGRLILKNHNACNLTRSYGITKVFVSAPNITEIRNSSGLTVRSQGVLNYPNLILISEDFEASENFHTDGDFHIAINAETLEVVTNNLSSIFISGSATNLSIGFYSGDNRFEGANLIAQNVTIFQRSSNDIIINPQQSLKGEIRSTGNVIALNRPPVIKVEQFYTGRLIFQ